MNTGRLTLQTGLVLAVLGMGAIGAFLALATANTYRQMAVDFQRDYLAELMRRDVEDQLAGVARRMDALARGLLADPELVASLRAGNAEAIGERLAAHLHGPAVALQVLPAKQDGVQVLAASAAGAFADGPRCPDHPFGAATGSGRGETQPELCRVGGTPYLVVRHDLPLPAATAQVRVFADPMPAIAEVARTLDVGLRLGGPDGPEIYRPATAAGDSPGALTTEVSLGDRSGASVIELVISKRADAFLWELQRVNQRTLVMVALITLAAVLLSLLLAKYAVIDPLRRLTRQLRTGTLPASVDDLAARGTRGGIFSLRLLGELYGTLRELAIKDPLTGLYNRALFEDKLQQFINDAHRAPRHAAVVMLDLDRFKAVNDTLGHQVGDRVIEEAAERLRALLRISDVLSRFGGDEFTLLIPDAGPDDVAMVTSKIVTEIEREFRVRGHRISLSASVGVALFPEHGQDVGTLLQRADSAMYEAKRGDKKIWVYQAAEGPVEITGLVIAHELRRAIREGSLSLHYQPVIDAGNHHIDYYEALLRWGEPGGSGFSTAEMVRVAERSGLIRPLTNWLMDEVCRQLAGWRDTSPPIRVGINLSMEDLHDTGLPDRLQRLIQAHGVDPGRLVVEITENGIMQDAEQVLGILRRLADMGISLSIDDFGTGQASLSYLKRLPVQSVKIDRSFVSDMDHNEDDAAIVRATIDLAHDLGLKVTAEGVEAGSTYARLEALGCDRMQGYFISEPMTAERVPGWSARPARAAVN